MNMLIYLEYAALQDLSKLKEKNTVIFPQSQNRFLRISMFTSALMNKPTSPQSGCWKWECSTAAGLALFVTVEDKLNAAKEEKRILED